MVWKGTAHSLAALALAGLCCWCASAQGQVLLSDFSNFSLTGTYVAWDGGTFTSGPDDFRAEAFDFGGGFYELPESLDATGLGTLEVQLDVNPATTSSKFNVVLFDADGTERVYRFDDITMGDNQSLTKDLGDFLQDNNPGTVPGLDVSQLTVFHLQGTFENGDPGLFLDLTFDNLAVVPEPNSVALGMLALVGFGYRRRACPLR